MSRRQIASDAWGSVLRVHAALVPRLDQRLQAESGLSLSWYDVLLELSSAPGGRLRMSDLGDKAVLSRTRVSRVVDEMERAGLVSREANDDDRRSAYTTLTPEGRRVYRRAAPKYVDAIEEEFASGLSAGELRTVHSALSRVLAALRGDGGGP
jgi:DNA-binding MarR family transcriptional regulator